ncbi:MAG: hypothetical protein NTY05_00495 [Rhodocyclales bacterium]|nr:hypothetical protein [Rhodocyclales bacterium]
MTLQLIRNQLWRFCLTVLCFVGTASGIEPVSGDFTTINDARSNQLVIWRTVVNPEIYVFDFPNLTMQGRTFNRITHFTEQQSGAPALRVFNDAEMAQHIAAAKRTVADFAFGHDVMVWDLAQFFTMADHDKVELSPEETALRDFLVEQGLLGFWRRIWLPLKPLGVILSVPQVQDKRDDEPPVTKLARYTVLLHEMAHGEYFSNPPYATYCQHFWNESLNDEQREKFRAFLTKYNYSIKDNDLLINEVQAYLMFTPDPSSFNAKKLDVLPQELDAMRNTFRSGGPPTKLPLTQKE